MSNIRTHVIISGSVQGVAFRFSMRDVANNAGVTGWVRNAPDGTVEAVIEGEEKRVNSVIDWSRHGPPSARVTHVEIREESYSGEYSNFTIIEGIGGVWKE